MRIKTTMTVSVDAATRERLKAYAEERHTTVSQAITDWIWTQEVKMADNGNEKEKDDANV